MTTLTGVLRKKVFAPALESVRFADRGFPGAASPSAERLELIPQAVVCGFEWGMEAGGLWELERRLTMIDAELRGFAYEGATMAWTIRDTMPGGRKDRTRELLLGPGREHLFLAYIGIGFAMARLPRPLWRGILPDLTGLPYHPTMSWLAVDGYGFDMAYFHTRDWVDEQRRPQPYPWDGAPDYFPRAFDQGVGRALWFIHGADPAAVAGAVHQFDTDRWADLFSGVGLAAAFAGGCDESGFQALAASAGAHLREVALGVVFAVKARSYAGLVPAHTELAARILGGTSVADAVALADATEVREGTSVPAYELWRDAIRSHFTDRQSKAA